MLGCKTSVKLVPGNQNSGISCLALNQRKLPVVPNESFHGHVTCTLHVWACKGWEGSRHPIGRGEEVVRMYRTCLLLHMRRWCGRWSWSTGKEPGNWSDSWRSRTDTNMATTRDRHVITRDVITIVTSQEDNLWHHYRRDVITHETSQDNV